MPPGTDDPLRQAVEAFVGADSWAGSRVVLEHHPELLSDAADDLLADAPGDAHRACRDVLRRCRADGAAVVFADLIGSPVPVELRPAWADAELAYEHLRAGGGLGTLDVAVARTTSVLDDPHSAGVAPSALAGMARAAAGLLVERHLRHNRPADLDAAVALYERAAAALPADDSDRPELLSSLGNVLGMRFEERGQPADLAAGIDSVRAALEAGEGLEPAERRVLHHNLAANLGVHAEIFGDPFAVDEAVDHARHTVGGSGHDALPAFLDVLGGLLLTRYERDGALVDLREAASTAGRGLGGAALPELQALLGTVRQLEFDRDRDPSTLDAAVDLLDAASANLAGGRARVDRPRPTRQCAAHPL